MRLHDRAQAASLLAPVVAGRTSGPVTIVGIGAGGAAVARRLAARLGARWGRIDLEAVEAGDALHPPTFLGAVAADGRMVLSAEGLDGLTRTPARLRSALERARGALAARLSASRRDAAPPKGPRRDEPPPRIDLGPAALAGTTVVVDDGTSPAGILRAGVDLVRQSGARRVVVAVACGPAEHLEQMGRWAGEVCAGLVPPWTEWYGWNGCIYDEDAVVGAPPDRARPGAPRPEPVSAARRR